MIVINHQHFTEEDVRRVFDLAKELVSVNEEQNAKLIAMNAKLENEERKVKELQYRLMLLQQQTLNAYNEENN